MRRHSGYLPWGFLVFACLAFISPFFGNSTPIFLWETIPLCVNLCGSGGAHPNLVPRGGPVTVSWPISVSHPVGYSDWFGDRHRTQSGPLKACSKTFAGTHGRKRSLSTGIAQLVEQKPGATMGHFCHHVGKARQRTEVELRDRERLIPHDAVGMLDPARPESILAFLTIMSQYVPYFFILRSNTN